MNQDAKLPIDKKWSYLKNNFLNGPFTDQELISAYTDKKIESQDLILNTVDQKWYSIEELPFLKASPALSVAPASNSHQAKADIAYQEFNHFVNHQSFSLNNENSVQTVSQVTHSATALNNNTVDTHATSKESLIESHMSDDEVRRHNELLKSQPQIVVPPSSEMKTKPSIAFSGIHVEATDSVQSQNVRASAESFSLKNKIESRKKTVIFSAIAVLVLILLIALNLKKENPQTDLEDVQTIDDNSAGQSSSLNKNNKDAAAPVEQVSAAGGDSAPSSATSDKSVAAADIKTEDPMLAAEKKAKYMIYLDRHKKLTEEIKAQVEILNMRFNNNIKQKIRVSKYWDKYYTEWLDVSNRVQAEIDLSVSESKDDADMSLILTKFTNLYNSVKTYTDLLNSNLRQFFSSQKLSEEKSIQLDAFKEKINSQVNEVELKIKDLEKKEAE